MSRRLALPLALLLSGCIGQRPAPPQGAAVSPPPAWRESVAPSAAIEVDWWRRFGDPDLTALVEEALSNNAQIGLAAARVAEARAHLHEARAARGPELDFTGIGGYTRQLEVTGPVTTWGAEPEGTIAYDFDLFGRLASASAASRAQLLATKAAQDAVRLAVAGTTAQTYIALLGYDRRLAIARSTLQARAQALDIQRRLTGGGYSSKLELRQAESEFRATEQLVPQAELAVTQTEDALSILVGRAPSDIHRSMRGLEGLAVSEIPGGLPSEILRRRPDVFAAEESVVAADRSLDSARAAMLPSFALTGSGGAIFASVLANPQSIFLIGGSVLAPLFDSGRRRANADVAAARRDQAAYQYRDTVLEALKEVEDALADVRRSDERRLSLLAQVEAQQAELDVASKRYRAGYASYLTQIDAQRALLSAQLSLAEAETSRLNAYVALYRALGGGWSRDALPADARPVPARPS